VNDPNQVVALVNGAVFPLEVAEISAVLDEASDGGATADEAERLRGLIELRALNEEPTPGAEQAARDAKAVKASPVYRDSGTAQQSNWLNNALSRLRRLFDRPREDAPRNRDGLAIGPWLSYLMWTLLAVGVLVLIAVALRHVDWKRRLARRAKALLEEDEPERTVDEWLAEADRLAAEGRHREAVRGLYLACLLRFDEAGVARFDRGHTNWEHLARISRSPRLPEGLDFRGPTKEFDRIWYGNHVRGLEDVTTFRSAYQTISQRLGEVKR